MGKDIPGNIGIRLVLYAVRRGDVSGILPQDGSLALKAPVTRSRFFCPLRVRTDMISEKRIPESCHSTRMVRFLKEKKLLPPPSVVKRGIVSGDDKEC